MTKPKKYRRPIGTTANPGWDLATTPEDMVPATPDYDGRGQRMWDLVGLFTLSQMRAGVRLADTAMAWQREITRYVFGQLDEEGNREVNRVFIKCGKGSGKSVLVSAFAQALMVDYAMRGLHHRALIMILSPNVRTSDIVFQHVLESIKLDPELKDQFRTYTAKRQLVHVESGITLEIAPVKIDSAIGRRPICLISDETHSSALECKQFANVLDQARRGGSNWGAEFLEIHISTSPPEKSAGVWSELLNYARQVRDGKIHDPSFLPVLFEWPTHRQDLDPEDPGQWWRGMPSCVPGGTMDPAEMAREFAEAKRTESPATLARLLSQRLGIEPNEGSVGRSVLQSGWEGVPVPLDPAAKPRAVALDPGGVNDPFAVAFAWWDNPESPGVLCVRVKQYLSRHGYTAAPDFLRAIYDKAIACDELTLYDTVDALDAAVIASIRLSGIGGYGSLCGGDRHGRSGFVPRLEQEVIGHGQFEEVKQGWTLVRAYDALEAMVLDQKLRVVHSPLLSFNIQNLRLEDGPQGRRFAKDDAGLSGSGQMKIDGLMAVLSATELMLERGGSETFASIGWIG